VGLPLQRTGVWPQGRGRQPDIAAAVSCRRALLVAASGALGRWHGGAAAPVLGEPVLAGVDRASRDADIPRPVHVDGAAKPDRAGAAFLPAVVVRSLHRRRLRIQFSGIMFRSLTEHHFTGQSLPTAS